MGIGVPGGVTSLMVKGRIGGEPAAGTARGAKIERLTRYLNGAILFAAACCVLLLLVIRIDINLGCCHLTCVGVKRPLTILMVLYAAKCSCLFLFRKDLARPLVSHFRRDLPIIVFFISLLSFFTLMKKQIVSAITPPQEQNRYLTGDEPSYMLMCQSVVLDKDVNLWNDSMERGGGVTFNNPRAGPHKAYMNRDEKRIYSLHSAGLPILISPVFALALGTGLAPRFACASALAILAALSMVLIFRLLRLSGASPVVRMGVAGALAITCPVMFYSYQVYPGSTGMLLVALAFLLVFGPDSVPGSRTRALLCAAAVGSCTAYLPWLHMRYSIFSLGIFAAFILYRRRPILSIMAAATPAAVSAILLMCAYNRWFGSPMPNAAYVSQGWSSTLDLSPLRAAKCLTGVLVDSGSGLLMWSPYLLFIPAGIVFCMRMDRKRTLLMLLPTVLYFGVVGTWHEWWGGFCPPGRMLVPLMPMLAFWTAGFLAGNRKKGLTALFVVLVAVSAFLAARAAYGDYASLYQKRNILETYPLFSSDVFVKFFTPRVFHNENRPLVYGAAYLLVAGLLNLYALVGSPPRKSACEA